jgi:hypothetical protein
LIELTSKALRKAKEKPATRALIKADCLQISAKLSDVRFIEVLVRGYKDKNHYGSNQTVPWTR